MQFGSKARRAFWWTLLTMLVPDCILAAGAALAFDMGLLGFGAGVVALQVFHFVRWILARIVDWAVFSVHGRKQMSRHLADYLRENRYPEPQPYEDSAESYLARVVEDRKVPSLTRLLAAAEVGTLTGWRTLRQYGIANRLEAAYEDALQEYKRSFPPKEPTSQDDIAFDDPDEDIDESQS
jgi:hypothetical protein